MSQVRTSNSSWHAAEFGKIRPPDIGEHLVKGFQILRLRCDGLGRQHHLDLVNSRQELLDVLKVGFVESVNYWKEFVDHPRSVLNNTRTFPGQKTQILQLAEVLHFASQLSLAAAPVVSTDRLCPQIVVMISWLGCGDGHNSDTICRAVGGCWQLALLAGLVTGTGTLLVLLASRCLGAPTRGRGRDLAARCSPLNDRVGPSGRS